MRRFSTIVFLFTLLLLQTSQASWRPGEMLVRLELKTDSQIRGFLDGKYNFDRISENIFQAYVTPDELVRLQSAGFTPQILIPDLEAYSRQLRTSPDFANYHDYNSTLTLVDSLLNAFPNLITKKIYGTSLQGRELYAVKISDNAAVDEPEPEIGFDGCHHGDETMGAEVLILLMRDLCTKYGNDPQITDLVNNREIWIFPFINPDGRQAMTRYNNNGVDVNRDWGYMWDAWGGSIAPFSQPESQAGAAFIFDNQFVISQSNHGGIEYISYPWSYRPDICPDKAPIDYLAAQYAAHSGYANLPYGQGYNGMYAINGSAKDSFYGLRGSVGWTMEVSAQKNPPASQIPMYYNYNKPAMLYLIEQAGKGISGTITDANTGNPVAGIVWVKDATTDYWPIYSDPQAGDFHKYLRPGTYDVKVTANGYMEATVTGVVVTDAAPAQVNFQLQPVLGTYAYRVIYCQIPGNNYGDEGYTPAALSAPDNINYSLGKGGYIVLDMGEEIQDFPGNDFKIVEGDASPEGYTVKIAQDWRGPWSTIGNGTGTTEFDMSVAGLNSFRYIRIEDDNDGPSSGQDAGFDLDAVEGRLIPNSGPFVMATSYQIADSLTNNNGIPEAGEICNLNLNLQNLGVDPAQNVRVTISSGDPLLTVLSDSAFYGNLSAGGSGWVTGYRIQIDPQTPHLAKLNLAVNIEADNGYTWAHPLQIVVREGAKIQPIPAAIAFEPTFLNFTCSFPLKIRNTGADTLYLNELLTASTYFWAEGYPAAVAPGAETVFLVKFQPIDTLLYLDTLTVRNSDPQHFVTKVPLSGEGILAPDIQTSPDSIVVQLLPTDSLEASVTIQNSGAGELNFTAQIGNQQTGEGAGGNDSFGHIWIDSDEPGGPSYDWVELANGAGTEIPISGLNSISDKIDIGFTVPFYDDSFNQLRVCNNGWVSFTTYSVSYNNTTLPSNLAPRAMIAPLWDNLYFQTDSKAYYLRETHRFIVQWNNAYTATGHGPYTFQLILHDNGNILLQYKSLQNLENAYTVGMQNSLATDGFHIAFNEPYLHDEMAILINRRSWVSLSPVGGTVAPGEMMQLTLTFKTTNFPLGDFWASLQIFSNDPDESTVNIPIHMVVDSTTSLQLPEENLARDFQLEQNYPNPFNPTTEIRFTLPAAARTELVVFNLRGQKVRTLFSGELPAGAHRVEWDATNDSGERVASGIYFYRLKTDSRQLTRRMLLLK
ncbi:MAG: hypothetical protein Kow0037_28570 [Calditrichia bacterium]